MESNLVPIITSNPGTKNLNKWDLMSYRWGDDFQKITITMFSFSSLKTIVQLQKTCNIESVGTLLWYFHGAFFLKLAEFSFIFFVWRIKLYIFFGAHESYRFGRTWGQGNDDRIFIFAWTIPWGLRHCETFEQKHSPLGMQLLGVSWTINCAESEKAVWQRTSAVINNTTSVPSVP